ALSSLAAGKNDCESRAPRPAPAHRDWQVCVALKHLECILPTASSLITKRQPDLVFVTQDRLAAGCHLLRPQLSFNNFGSQCGDFMLCAPAIDCVDEVPEGAHPLWQLFRVLRPAR